jgi:flavin-dependent dehydrogenase
LSILQADVLIVGAGPAGATAALNLAGSRRVLLVDRQETPAPRIGESLPPAAGRLLADMGLLDSFLRQGHSCYHGNRALWNGVQTEHHFLRDLDGHGWHLARDAFDAWLRAEARGRGAALLAPANVEEVDAREGGWQVLLRTAHATVQVRAGIIIDASGRGALIARKLGARRQRLDRLACTWLYGRDLLAAAPGYSDIEASEHGWWYSAALPEQRRVLAFHTDADLDARSGQRDADTLLATARALPGMGVLLARGGFAAETPASTTAAHSAMLEPAAGAGWFAAGDAAVSFDPLSSQGIFNALYTGLAAAEAADRALAGDATAQHGYCQEIAGISAAYRLHLAYCYGQERRWPQSAFWQRRLPQSRH